MYHPPPNRHHGLGYVFQHLLDDLTPALLIGDFNTHSPRWSDPDHHPSPWALAFHDWMDNSGLHCLNDPATPTWFGSRDTDCPSVLDLALVNEAAIFEGQLSELTISHSESLGSNHTALLLDYYLTEGVIMTPPPAPAGYWADADHWDAWVKAFTTAYHTSDNLLWAKDATTSAPAGGGMATAHYLTPGAETNTFGVHNPIVSSPLIATQPNNCPL